MVQLKRNISPELVDRFAHFNPTLVQLKHLNRAIAALAKNLFQSHIGTIKAEHEKTIAVLEGNFNPTLVQLKPTAAPASRPSLCYFNPTLVQLKRKRI